MSKTNVLICDDSAFARKQMARAIPDGWDVLLHFAKDGQEALEMIRAGKGDVMFLDLSMPRMSGEEVVRWLRAHPDVAPGLRIVVVSAWAGDKRPTLHELGVDAVLPKPFRKQQLLDLLEELAQPR